MLKPVSVNSGIWQVVAYIIKILIMVKRKSSTQEEREETRESVLIEQEKNRQCLKESEMIFALLIQHHKNEISFH